MARRIAALLGIVVIVALVLLLMWRVEIHHHLTGDDEPTVVALHGRST